MSSVTEVPRPLGPASAEDPSDRTFEALVFDWDGTAVPDRASDATRVRELIERLCAAGVHVIVVSGTHVGNVDGQLAARPTGPGRLHLCLNRGSEVFEAASDGVTLVWRRDATEQEEEALDRAAALTVERLGALGLQAAVVSQRLNRRKIDLITDPAWADPPKARIAELAEAVHALLARTGVADLAEVVATAGDAAREAGIVEPKITSDVKHVEIGLTDKADSGRWAATWLAGQGITGGLILVGGDELGPVGGVPGSDSMMLVPDLARAAVVSVGVEPGGVAPGVVHLPGGPARFTELLEGQLARRREHRVPWIDEDPGWIVPLPADPTQQRVAESLGALANGHAGIRAACEEGRAGSAPLFVVNGVYDDAAIPRLVEGPVWTGLAVADGGPGERIVDLRTGVLARRDSRSGLRSVRFVSASRPSALGLRAEAPAANLEPADPFPDAMEWTDHQPIHLASTAGGNGNVAVAVRDRWTSIGRRRSIDRVAAWVAHPAGQVMRDQAEAALAEVDRVGFDHLLTEHRSAWAQRWGTAGVTIDSDDPRDQLAARFAVFHLLSVAPDDGEAAVGPRGLTGPAYGGHVFWDADVYVLPALAAIRPAAARAMIQYRLNRFPRAQAIAAAEGLAGARFPWESGADGSDVTPRHATGADGTLIPIRTGDHEEHIIADVPWAIDHYATWTGDDPTRDGTGRDLVLDTARYWASRARVDHDGHAHLDGLMGPDEYHEIVDDNAYTNVMARWNLRLAADLAERTDGDRREVAAWRDLAMRLVDGWCPTSGLYEQFSGYFELEPLLASGLAPRPYAADVLLGAPRVAGSQIIKQPDVLMLHHLVPDDVEGGSLDANLDYYEPRTSHGSSLSPAIHASLFARAGQPDRALELFRLAAYLDLDDLTGTTAGGLHLGTMGGLWQALAQGFLGLRPHHDHLAVDPCLPTAWRTLGLRFHYHGQPIEIRAGHDTVRIACGRPLPMRISGGPTHTCDPPGAAVALGHPRPEEGTRR